MSRTKVLFPKYGKYYEADLSKSLSLAGYEVMEASDSENFESFYSNLCLSSSGSTTVIVDVDNTACVLSIIRSVYPTVNKPKLILITSLLTWCGETQHRSVSDPDLDFCSRKPLQCTLKAYGLENTLWNIASTSQEVNNLTYFVGTGLLYGGWGWDFESALRRSWDDSCQSCTEHHSKQAFSLPFMNGCNNVGTNTLATHIEDFIHGIINLVKDDSLISPSFHPMVDGINDSDFSSHGCNCNLFNECPVDPLGNISSSTNILTEILRDPRTLLMSSKVFFTSKSIAPSIRDLRNFPSVLKEFTVAHKLSPVNLIFVGGPRCGKTETAQLVAKMLDLQYVGLVDSIRWVLDAYIDANEVDSDKNSDPDKIGPGRSLAEFVMAKVAEGTKKGSFSGGGVSLQSFDLSDNFVSTIPVSLQRKCIAQRLESCRKCCLKGYVMDVWGTGASIATPATFISSVEDFVELLPASVSQQLTQRSMDPGSLSEIKSLDMTILEFQSDRKDLLQRFPSKILEGKITKDQQAAVKAFEARLDKYSARLLKTANTCFLSEIIESEDGSGDVNLSHEIVIDFIKLSGCQHASIRSSNQSNIDSMARVVTEKIIPAVHGPLGWSPSLPGANPLDEESAKDTSATVSAAPSPKHRLGSSSIQHHTPFGSDNLGEESDSFSRINEGLAGLKEKEKEVLMSNCKELLEYLEVNVTPFLTRGLIDLERTKPEDPISFLIDVLEKQSAKNRAEAEECALNQFLQVLKEAEAVSPFGAADLCKT